MTHSSDQAWEDTAAKLVSWLDSLESLTSTDPQRALAAATEVEHRANLIGRQDLVRRAQLVRGYAHDRLGGVSTGGRIAYEVNRWAAEHGHQALLARSHLQLCWFFNMIGDTPARLEHALRGLECLDEHAPARIRADHLQALAGALITNGSYPEAASRFQMAEDLAMQSGDVHLQIKVLNNRAFGEFVAGNAQAAMDTADRMLALAATHDFPLEITALDTVACAQMALGRYAEAEQTLLTAADRSFRSRGTNGEPEAQILLTLAEAQRLLGAIGRARATLARCLSACEVGGLAGVRVGALREQAELLAMEGNYRDAYELHKVFHAESEALRSMERDARTRTLQAVFETDEARRESLRFREMSLRDPLTGLYNRRFVDERIDAALQEWTIAGSPLSIAVIDLDHFKQVNDAFSHAIGDEVLKEVARVLSSAVIEPAFAARLGGEEFLLFLPDTSREQALSLCKTARLLLRSHDWSTLIGKFSVTASFGVSFAAATRSSRPALLAAADRNLYAAKRAGRDRVISDIT
ncbi:MAG: GGDEF domain-containing protein [Actinomycetota bacterium]|nr:GGDEF domain-containing protein [Actinomycetota bacterium]